MIRGSAKTPQTIDSIIKALKACENQQADVRFDFMGCLPTVVASWRGDYSEPAIGWTRAAMTSMTVADLITELTKASTGAGLYQGWKGGDYRFYGSQQLHVDNPGEYHGRLVVGIYERDEDRVYLLTEEEL